MRVAYFTAGTVGAGHLVRGLAIARGLARAGFAGEYRIFGPPLPFPAAETASYQAVTVKDDPLLRHPAKAEDSELAQSLKAFGPDLLLVDLFWAPLYHLLPTLGCPSWLLVRCCPPIWLVGPPETPFRSQQYQRLLAIEPFPYEAVDASLPPIVIANPEECRPPEALRERVGAGPDEALWVVLHAGEPGEISDLHLEAVTQGEAKLVRCDLFQREALFPAAEWLGGADRIFSGAGYNAYWEAKWLGHFERTHFTAFARQIDNQKLRLATFGSYRPLANGADALAELILAG
ncbi:MAG TPA: hypothetical protein PK413_10625 [Thermoanaerobaculia bacterium]|nr:hypothetical protein [Thermoanaerobaculia bacterium]